MKKLLTLIVIGIFSCNISAQELICGTHSESFEKELQRRQLLQKISGSKKIVGITYVPIKIHLFGQDDNTGYVSPDDINNTLADMNACFSPSNIQFYFSGTTFNHYPNSAFDDGMQTTAANDAFHATNGATDAINVYFSKVVMQDGISWAGYAWIAPTTQINNMIRIMTSQQGTTKHEMGHFFGLRHTFDGSDSNFIPDRELVTRNFNEIAPRLSANCTDKGDFLCDTPSDPYPNTSVDPNTCAYTGTAIDANGDHFSPLLYNIMSYYGCNRNSFTPGQCNRIDDTLLIFLDPNNGFTLTAPETVQPVPTNLVATDPNPDYYGTIILNWKDNSSVETGYIIERSTSENGPFIAIAGVKANITSFTNSPVDGNQTYYYRVKPSNSKNQYSTISNPILTSALCGNQNGQSCSLDQNPVGPDIQIENFVLRRNSTAIIDNSHSGCSIKGFGNYYNTKSATVLPGETLGFTVEVKTYLNNGNFIHVQLYADWNNDNKFDDKDELVFSNGTDYSLVTGSIAIPASLQTGNYRLRVTLTSNFFATTNACNMPDGEIEDYKLIVNSLGVAGFNESGFSIYPNPATDRLSIKHLPEFQIDSVIITDISGKKVLQPDMENNVIDISRLQSGMYLIQIYSGARKFTSKFIRL